MFNRSCALTNSEPRPLHVLVAPSWTDDPERPYNGIFFREQARALRDANLRVGFACVEQRSLRKFAWPKLRESHFQISFDEAGGVRTVRMHGWNTLCQTRAGALLWTRLLHRAMKRYIAKEGLPDLIHAHSTLWAGYAALTFSRAYGLPYVVTEHSTAFARGLIAPGSAPFVRNTLQGAAAVITVGHNLKRLLAQYLPQERIAVIPNLLDASFFTGPVRRRPPGGPGLPFVFLSIGNLIPAKGFDVLLQAFARVFRGCPEVSLEIGGDGPMKGELVALATRLGIAGQVTFRGSLARAEVRETMLAADAFVLASYVETFGVVVAEAMALGLPVIATRSGGPEDFVTPESGYLVSCGDTDALAHALGELRFNFRYAPEAIRAHVRRYASPAVVTKALEQVYTNALQPLLERPRAIGNSIAGIGDAIA